MTSTLDEPGIVWTVQTTSDQLDVRLERGECWWGGAVADGRQMPFGDRPHARDLARTAGAAHDALTGANQSAPLLLSSTGRVVWSERPFAYAFDDGRSPVAGRRRRRRRMGARTTPHARCWTAAAVHSG